MILLGGLTWSGVRFSIRHSWAGSWSSSIVAEVVSELADTEVYHWFVTKITHRYQWARVLVSNSVSVPIDNLIFAVGAFGGILPWEVVWQIFTFNLILKYVVTVVSMPLIYVTRDRDWTEQ